MIKQGTYPSKIMLVGEYGVVVGGSALTIPYYRFSAKIRSVKDIPPGKEKEARQSLEYLQYLFDHIQNLPANTFHAPPDLDRFAENLRGSWLDLDIPVGYGLGSSGAVSAAVYDLFFTGRQNLTLEQSKNDLAAIESYFHGKSSGLDALTCYTGTALRVHQSGGIERVHFDPSLIPGDNRFFLLNSGERFDTAPLVKYFLEQMKDPAFRSAIEGEYLPLNQKLIESLLGDMQADPSVLLKELSGFQLRYFRKMIPEHAVDLWIEGLDTGAYCLKLNGSGGGMMLGITHRSETESLEKRWGEKFLLIV